MTDALKNGDRVEITDETNSAILTCTYWGCVAGIVILSYVGQPVALAESVFEERRKRAGDLIKSLAQGVKDA